MNKKELAKCKPGTWLLIHWNDSEPCVAMLLEKVDRDLVGEVSLKCFYPETYDVNSHAVHTQVLEIKGHIDVDSYKDVNW